jgi:hypothetical protein
MFRTKILRDDEKGKEKMGSFQTAALPIGGAPQGFYAGSMESSMPLVVTATATTMRGRS